MTESLRESLREALHAVDGRLVVRLPNWIGDAMMALPAVRALRQMAPSARLEVHGRAPVADVFASFRGVADRVVTGGDSSVAGVVRDARRLRGAAACVLLPNSFVAALPPFLAGIPLRAGAATDGRGPLLSWRTRPDAKHMAAYYCEAVGADAGLAATGSGVEIDPALRQVCRSLTGPDPYAVLVPGAAYGTAKRWLPERFAAVGRQIGRLGLRVFVLGSASEAALAAEVAMTAGGRSLAGATSGMVFAGLIAGARVAVVNDSGAMHVAAGLRTPVVAIFGATDPTSTGPVGGTFQVVYRPPSCSPCGARRCPLAVHECMEAVSAEEVFTAVRRLVDRPDGGAEAATRVVG